MASNHPYTDLSYTHLGRRWGLAQKWYAFQNVKDYIDDLGYNIAKATAEFPRYVGYLQSLGWTNDQILNMNLFTMCYNESVLDSTNYTGIPGNIGLSMAHIDIPPGKWWFTSELLAPMGVVSGAGSAWNFGSGGTWLVKDSVQFKSILESYGEDEEHGFISMNLYKDNWSHAIVIRDLHLTGDAGDYNDPSYKSNGIMIQSPGETCIIENCFIEQWNNAGYMPYKFTAPTRVVNCSFFYNGVAGIDIADCALGVVSIERPSGDQNPTMVRCSHWDHSENPGLSIGGEITITTPKVEAYPGSVGLAIYGSEGKGQMLFWFDGFDAPGTNTLFRLTVIGGQCFCNGGYMESLIRLHQYNPGVGHWINAIGLNVHRYMYLITDTVADRKWGDSEIGWFTQVGGPFNGQHRFPEYYYHVQEFRWNANDQIATKMDDSTGLQAMTGTAATCDRLHGPQEQDPGSSFLAIANKWDPNNCNAVAGKDPVTGIAYP